MGPRMRLARHTWLVWNEAVVAIDLSSLEASEPAETCHDLSSCAWPDAGKIYKSWH